MTISLSEKMAKEYKTKKYNNHSDAVAAAASETGNRPPYAPEIEEAVIGAMMLDEDCVYQGMEYLSEKSFYNRKLRPVFVAIKKLFEAKEAVDIATVAERLRRDGTLEEAGGTSSLTALTQNVGSAASFEYYVKILQQKTIQRDLIDASYGILKEAFDQTCPVEDLIRDAPQRVIRAVEGNLRSDYVPISDAVNKSLLRLQSIQGRKGLTGVPSGFPSLDAITMGWQPGNLIIIGARPSVGKTAFALNMARNAALDYGIPTAFFSLEMTDTELADRLIAGESGFPSSKLKGKIDLNQDEWGRLEASLSTLVTAPLYIDETSALHINEFRAKAIRLHREKGIKIVFVDYLQLMEATLANPGGSAQVQKITEISKQLKATAKELKIPIIALSQLNRNPTLRPGSNGEPQLSDLKDSGSIEQDADIVIFLHRPGMLGFGEDPEEFYKTEILIKKNRAGELGCITTRFHGEQVRFTEEHDNLLATARVLSEAKAQEHRAETRQRQQTQPAESQQSWSPFDMGAGFNPIDEFENAGNKQPN